MHLFFFNTGFVLTQKSLDFNEFAYWKSEKKIVDI